MCGGQRATPGTATLAELVAAEARRAQAAAQRGWLTKVLSFASPYAGEKRQVFPNVGPKEEKVRYALEDVDEAMGRRVLCVRKAA